MRFTIRWDDSMGCYRVSEPNIEGPMEVVAAKEYDRAAAALSDAYAALTADDLGPDCSETAVENAREVLADAILGVALEAYGMETVTGTASAAHANVFRMAVRDVADALERGEAVPGISSLPALHAALGKLYA